MKLNRQAQFPHPVLDPHNEAYSDAIFKVDLAYAESLKNNALTVECKTQLKQPDIDNLIKLGKAKIGIAVVCPATYYNRIIEIDTTDTELQFLPGELNGLVTLQPIIYACQDIDSYSSNQLHTDYNNMDFDVEAGSLLAWDEINQVNIGLEKLRPLDSIFNITVDEGLEEGQIGVDPGQPKITISCCEKTRHTIQALRSNSTGKAIVLNSVYLPAVMEVMSYIKDDNVYEDKSWYPVFKARCEHLNIDLNDAAVFANAQKVLNYPFIKIQGNFQNE